MNEMWWWLVSLLDLAFQSPSAQARPDAVAILNHHYEHGLIKHLLPQPSSTSTSTRQRFLPSKHDSCREDACDKSEKMPLPRNPFLPGKQSAQHAPIKHERDNGNDDPETWPFDNPPREKKTEIAEDKATRANVIRRRRTKRPESHSAHGNDEQSRGEENLPPSDENDTTENQKRQSVRNEMSKAEMEKRRSDNPWKPGDGSGLNPEAIQKTKENGIKYLKTPG